MVMSPQVSWLFFKAREKRPYLSHTGRASNAEKQPTGRGPEGCVENGPAAALLVGYVSIEICALLASCRRPILNATTPPLYARQYTTMKDFARTALMVASFRAKESNRPNRLFYDPLSSVLAGEDALRAAANHHRDERLPYLAIRTRFFDDWLEKIVDSSLR